MKPPPDETVLEELSAATKERRLGGKWRLVVVIGLLLMLVIGGSIFGLEMYRQSGIRSARAEFTQEVLAVRSRYADVSDWASWYREKLP